MNILSILACDLQEPEVQELGVTADTEGVQRAESPDGVVHLFSKLPSVSAWGQHHPLPMACRALVLSCAVLFHALLFEHVSAR